MQTENPLKNQFFPPENKKPNHPKKRKAVSKLYINDIPILVSESPSS